MSNHSPPISTTLEPCRVAPYVNVPSMRSNNNNTSVTSSAGPPTTFPAFSAFDPALISAAHQVNKFYYLFNDGNFKINDYIIFVITCISVCSSSH